MIPWSQTVCAAAVMALACTSSKPEMLWMKPGATDSDFYRMRAYCVNEAGIGALSTNAATPRFVACMQSDGWVQIPRGKTLEPRFTWLRSDGTSASRTELEKARKECQGISRDDPSSPLYGPNILECIQSKGYRLIEEDTK